MCVSSPCCVASYRKLSCLKHQELVVVLSPSVWAAQEPGSGLAEWFWLRASHETAFEAARDWGVPSQAGSLLGLDKPCWLLARGLCPLPHRPAHRAAGVSSPHGRWFSPRQWSEREQDGSCTVLCDLPSAVPGQHSCRVLLVTQASPPCSR